MNENNSVIGVGCDALFVFDCQACGSYLYEGEKILRDRTDICEAVEALNDAAELLAEIMRDEVNPQDEAEKWLRAYAPQYLAHNV